MEDNELLSVCGIPLLPRAASVAGKAEKCGEKRSCRGKFDQKDGVRKTRQMRTLNKKSNEDSELLGYDLGEPRLSDLWICPRWLCGNSRGLTKKLESRNEAGEAGEGGYPDNFNGQS